MGFKSIVLGASVLTLSTSVNAAIISADWQSTGDNLITQDTASGLEWLDLTVTVGMSYDAVSAQLGTGGAYEGWRYATTSEVIGFFDAFGGDSGYYTGWSTQNNGLFDEIAPLWGDLFCSNYSSCPTGEGYSLVIHHGAFSTTSHATRSSIYDRPVLGQPDVTTHDYVQIEWEQIPITNSEQGMGSALVRDASVVPVPAAAWLFGSGLIGLVGLARRKK